MVADKRAEPVASDSSSVEPVALDSKELPGRSCCESGMDGWIEQKPRSHNDLSYYHYKKLGISLCEIIPFLYAVSALGWPAALRYALQSA